MAVVLRFAPRGMTAEMYDEVNKRLDKAGSKNPPGRLYHVCFGEKDNLRISDIWDSRESFEKFGKTVWPILDEIGIERTEPEFFEVYNMIEGGKAGAAKRT